MVALNIVRRTLGAGAAVMVSLAASAAFAEDTQVPAASDQGEAETWSFHAQTTTVVQFHPSFTSPYRGPNSLDPGNRGDETVDLTLFLGARVWQGGEVYVNPEVDQGFGLSDTLGAAGFPSGEAYKVGAADPYPRLPRVFLRQTFDLGGETRRIEADANQLAGARTTDNLVLTIGKLSVTDIFDTNSFAHDPRGDFLNWSIIDAGAFDYAADAWAYTYGAAAEWTQSWWTVRGGVFDLSRAPNTKYLQHDFSQFSAIAELEERHELWGQPGKLKLLGFVDYGRMAKYLDAVRLAADTDTVPNVANVRRYQAKAGAALNAEQQILPDLGAFLRLSADDGSKEAFEFTEINRSVSAGLSLKGERWDRPRDTIGVAFVVNEISGDARRYFAAGGLGILIGDGKLPQYSSEKIEEAYYSLTVVGGLVASIDYQFISNPAYNPDRGPVSVIGGRLHAEF